MFVHARSICLIERALRKHPHADGLREQSSPTRSPSCAGNARRRRQACSPKSPVAAPWPGMLPGTCPGALRLTPRNSAERARLWKPPQTCRQRLGRGWSSPFVMAPIRGTAMDPGPTQPARAHVRTSSNRFMDFLSRIAQYSSRCQRRSDPGCPGAARAPLARTTRARRSLASI